MHVLVYEQMTRRADRQARTTGRFKATGFVREPMRIERGREQKQISIFYRTVKGRRRGEWVILVVAQSLFALRCISQRVTKSSDASRSAPAATTPRASESLSSCQLSRRTASLLSDMKVQQGCNSSDMGIPVTTEEELRRNTVITPEDVLGLQKITKSK